MGNRNTKIVKKPNKAAEKARKERENKIFHYTIIGIFALIVILGFVVLATLPEKTDDSEANEQVEEMIVDGNGNIVLEEHDHDHDTEAESEDADVELEQAEPTEETETDKVEESENAGEAAVNSEAENDMADEMVQETEEHMAEPEDTEEVSEE